MLTLRAWPQVAGALLIAVSFVPAAVAAPGATGTPPPAAGAALELADVSHALQDRTLIVTGWVRNAGRLPVTGLVIDASGFAPSGDLAAFGSDGIPWAIRPNAAERFQIFLPLARVLVSNYTVTVSGSRPRQARVASLTRSIFPAFYRPLIVPRVRVDVSNEAFALTFTASADDLPVSAVLVTVNLLVQEKTGVVLRVLTVEVPVGHPMRLRFAPLIVRVVSVSVTEVILTSTWSAP